MPFRTDFREIRCLLGSLPGKSSSFDVFIPVEALTHEDDGCPLVYSRDHVALPNMKSRWNREVYIPVKRLFTTCSFVREMIHSFDPDKVSKLFGNIWSIPILEADLCMVVPHFQLLTSNLRRLKPGLICHRKKGKWDFYRPLELKFALNIRAFRHFKESIGLGTLIWLIHLCEFIGYRDGFLACISILKYRLFRFSSAFNSIRPYSEGRFMRLKAEWAWNLFGRHHFEEEQRLWEKTGHCNPNYQIEALVLFGCYFSGWHSNIRDEGCCHFAWHRIIRLLRNAQIRQIMFAEVLRGYCRLEPRGQSLGALIRAQLTRRIRIDTCTCSYRAYMEHVIDKTANDLENVFLHDFENSHMVVYDEKELARLLKSN